jgi:hypothetical protein
MRDIRDDLKERLALLRAERDALQAQLESKLAEIDAYEGQLTGLLTLEEARAASAAAVDVSPTATDAPAEAEPAKTPEEINAQFEADILKILDDGLPREHSEIRAGMEEEGWVSRKKGGLGRQIQGVLLTLKNRRLVNYAGDSIWQKAKVMAETTA